jgi:hypothetical protein
VHDKGKTLSSVTEELRLHKKEFRIGRVEDLMSWLFFPMPVGR